MLPERFTGVRVSVSHQGKTSLCKCITTNDRCSNTRLRPIKTNQIQTSKLASVVKWVWAGVFGLGFELWSVWACGCLYEGGCVDMFILGQRSPLVFTCFSKEDSGWEEQTQINPKHNSIKLSWLWRNWQRCKILITVLFWGICTLFKYNLNWLLVLLLDYISEENTVLFTPYNFISSWKVHYNFILSYAH